MGPRIFRGPGGGSATHCRPDRRKGVTAMDNTKLAAELCAIIDRMNVIIQAQAMELAQLHALHHEEEIAAVRRDYAQAIGEVTL